jgi:hypothetical protein
MVESYFSITISNNQFVIIIFFFGFNKQLHLMFTPISSNLIKINQPLQLYMLKIVILMMYLDIFMFNISKY